MSICVDVLRTSDGQSRLGCSGTVWHDMHSKSRAAFGGDDAPMAGRQRAGPREAGLKHAPVALTGDAAPLTAV
jgi:hypothetical protein